MSSETPIDGLSPEVRRAIERAEKLDGFSYGAKFTPEGRECFVSVSFYPERQWWVSFRGDAQKTALTKEFAATLSGLRL